MAIVLAARRDEKARITWLIAAQADLFSKGTNRGWNKVPRDGQRSSLPDSQELRVQVRLSAEGKGSCYRDNRSLCQACIWTPVYIPKRRTNHSCEHQTIRIASFAPSRRFKRRRSCSYRFEVKRGPWSINLRDAKTFLLPRGGETRWLHFKTWLDWDRKCPVDQATDRLISDIRNRS